MGYNISPMDCNEPVKLPDLQMSGTSGLEQTNSPNSFCSREWEPNEHLKSLNLQLVQKNYQIRRNR
jgi:hypothetical protein